MGKTKQQQDQETEVEQFPISLAEFLHGFGNKQVESRKAFEALMKRERNFKTSAEWSKLFELFKKKPVGVLWDEWVKTEGGK